jgi:RNA polymerase sigma-70 factor (ECF subfamily)
MDDRPTAAHQDEHNAAKLAVRLATFSEHRGLLFSIAYRMLGTVTDAEDMLQEAFIRWQQAECAEVRLPRAFLVTIISRLCINHLQSARVQREEYVGQWLPEPIVTNTSSDPLALLRIDESLSMAFLVLLERLTPMERAVFLLREVFEYDYSEIAKVLDQTEANCRQILRRARLHIGNLRPRFKSSERKKNDLLREFREASISGDLERLAALLAEEAILHSDGGGKRVAVPNLVRGSHNVASAVIGGLRKLVPKNLVHELVEINGEPGVIAYLGGTPFSALTLEISNGLIKTIYIVTNPDKLAHLPVIAKLALAFT